MKATMTNGFTGIVLVSLSLSAAAICVTTFVACSDFQPATEDTREGTDTAVPEDDGAATTDRDTGFDPGQPSTDEGTPDYGQPHVGFEDAHDTAQAPDDPGNQGADQGQEQADVNSGDDVTPLPDVAAETGVDPVDPSGCPGYAGCACDQPEDCYSGLCVPTPDGHRCTRMCTTGNDCAEDEFCRVMNNDQGPDATYACLNRWPTACRPCVDDADCEVAWLDTGDQPACVTGGNNDSYCAPLADGTTMECPEGYVVERMELDRGLEWVCLPEEGSCPCTAGWQRPGFEMNCSVSNEFGTCRGIRLCNQECPAPMPSAETCDSLDNDCNGLVDDGITGRECDITNDIGTCVGHVQCANGLDICLGTEATKERCDGVDNDCDGRTDEDLGLTWCGIGKCSHMVQNCQDGNYQICNPLEGAATEVCNGIDDDCDGKTDEELGKTTCGLGVCTRSVDKCVAGKLQQCVPLPAKDVEKCDELDNDCDGMTDEGFGVVTCGLGPCRHSVNTCVDGVPDVCDPYEGATDETCDGFDEDCDGLVDNNIGYAASLFEPNNTLGAALNIGDVYERDPTRIISAMVYPAGDTDFYFFKAVEADHSCSLGWDQDYKITVTLFNPIGPFACHGQTLVLYNSAGTVLASDLTGLCVSHTLEYKWDGECGPNDSREFYVKVGAPSEDAVSCMPYQLHMTMRQI